MKRSAWPVASRRRRITSTTRACVTTSSAVVGSSASRSSARQRSASARQTRWRWPPESSAAKAGSVPSGSSMPTSARSATTSRRASPRVRSPPSAADPLARLARSAATSCAPTVTSGFSAASESCCTAATRPRRWRGVAGPTARPPSSTTPRTRDPGGSVPSTARAVSDLPDPDAPTSATRSPAPTRRSTSCTSGTRSIAIERERTSRAGCTWPPSVRARCRAVRRRSRRPY